MESYSASRVFGRTKLSKFTTLFIATEYYTSISHFIIQRNVLYCVIRNLLKIRGVSSSISFIVFMIRFRKTDISKVNFNII